MANTTGAGALQRRGAALLLALAVAACGGGGGSPGTAPPPPPPPVSTPPAPPPVGSRIPSTFAVSFPEAIYGINPSRTSFKMYAPSQALPSSGVLFGADAQFFAVGLAISSVADGAGFRDARLDITVDADLNFEKPSDLDKNNTYVFTMSLVYPEGTLNSVITVTITDTPEGLEAESVSIEGEAVNQMFGAPMVAIPDITGDGKDELAISVLSNRGPASAYVVSSEFYGSIPSGYLSISSLGTQGTRFRQTPTAPVNELSFRSGRANLLTAEKRASGGADILLSDAERKAFYLFTVSGPVDYAALRGDIDPASVADAIVYSASPTGPALEARLIGDVNGDDLNDIFVQPVDASLDTPITYGIILGRPVAAPADRARSANAFDISFNALSPKQDNNTKSAIPRLLVQKISDITGDGAPELVISPHSGYTLNANVARQESWLIKSPILRGATPRTVSLTGASGDPVTFLKNLASNSLVEIPDQDADGLKTVVFNVREQNEVALRLLDGDLLNAAPQMFDVAGAGSGALRKTLFGGFIAPIGDVDNDGQTDFATGDREFGWIARHAVLAGPQTTLVEPDPGIPGSEWFHYNGLPITAKAKDSWPPVLLTGSAMIAFGFAEELEFGHTLQTIPRTAGRIVLVKQDDFRKSITSALPVRGAAGSMTIHVGQAPKPPPVLIPLD